MHCLISVITRKLFICSTRTNHSSTNIHWLYYNIFTTMNVLSWKLNFSKSILPFAVKNCSWLLYLQSVAMPQTDFFSTFLWLWLPFFVDFLFVSHCLQNLLWLYQSLKCLFLSCLHLPLFMLLWLKCEMFKISMGLKVKFILDFFWDRTTCSIGAHWFSTEGEVVLLSGGHFFSDPCGDWCL